MLNQYRYHAGQFLTPFWELSFSGEDVPSFLQKQATFDIVKMDEGTFHLVSFLDPQGRLECYGWLTFKDEVYTLLVPQQLLEQSLVRLNKFLISEDVTISEPVLKTCHFLLGPAATKVAIAGALKGVLFDEEAWLQFEPAASLPVVSAAEIAQWQALTGWPSFDGSDFSAELINNLRLFDLSVVMNKGCYPGQETVSKIATRRGAAYAPVLLELTQEAPTGEVMSFDKRIGTANACYEWHGRYYLTANLLRDFRVEGMKLHFLINNVSLEGVVRYYPLLSGNPQSKALELFYEASDHFKLDELKAAEDKFRLAIELDPGFADAYESLGVMLGRQERFNEAIALMEQLIQVDPKSVLAHTNLSLFLMKIGKITEAEEHKSMATVKSFQSFGEEAEHREAQDLIKKQQQQEWAQRESMFRQVLEIDPEDTLANYGVGSIAVEKGEWQTARTHLELVLQQDPKYSVAYLALGKALKGLGLVEEARRVWNEGIKVSAAKGDLMPANQMQQELNS